jgi:hypothetical protein
MMLYGMGWNGMPPPFSMLQDERGQTIRHETRRNRVDTQHTQPRRTEPQPPFQPPYAVPRMCDQQPKPCRRRGHYRRIG